MVGMTVADNISGERRVQMVCCHCRKVRTATGDWEQPPTHLPAVVSHGICRACLGAHYPEVVPPPEVR